MILIMSQYTDYATTQVINWLQYYGKKFIRINGDSHYNILEISDDEILVRRDGQLYNLYDCDSYWYRRCSIFPIHVNANPNKVLSDNHLLQCMKYPITAEYEVVREHIYRNIENKIGFSHCVGKYCNRSLNKLDVIKIAKSIGLQVPKTFLISSKECLWKHMKDSVLITKAASESIYSSDNDNYYVSYTTQINENNVTYLPSDFMVSLFQEKIEKKYELRIFYLSGKLYPSVIFSQEYPDGLTDCRRSSQYRYLPYKLPKDIILKLRRLMKQINLRTGSIDMIVDKNGNYIFLEINPVGQFVAYGEFCNYYLDREMAKIL